MNPVPIPNGDRNRPYPLPACPGATYRSIIPHRPPAVAGGAAGHRGDHRDPRPLRHRRVEAMREAHVLLAHVDVDEPAQRAAVVEEPAAEARVGGIEGGDDLAQRAVRRGHLGRAAGVGAQDGGNADEHGHGIASPKRSVNASSVGLMGAGTSVAAVITSSVFSPSPELMTTVSASGSSRPCASSLRSTPRVTPPAVSPKMPSVAASSRIESTISSSPTSAIAPPVRRTTSRAYGPSAGLPMASDLAIVAGRTGRTTSCPAANAADTGAHPLAWAPNTRHGVWGTRPRPTSSPNALSTFTSCAPEAIGTTTCSGSRQPSCSAISKPSVFDPSA